MSEYKRLFLLETRNKSIKSNKTRPVSKNVNSKIYSFMIGDTYHPKENRKRF